MQIPTPENPQAVVHATLDDEYSHREAVGISINKSGEYNPQALVDQATRAAKERTRELQDWLRDTQPAAIPQKGFNKQHNTKPCSITDKQLATLERMAEEKNISLEAMADEMFNVPARQLSSSQV